MRILAALLSIVMPRLGQIFNRQIIKGFVYLLAEHVVNTITHINRAIYLGFNGHQQASIDVLNHQLALFYPAIYNIGIWDAFSNAMPDVNRQTAIFFVIGGLAGTFTILYDRFLPFPS